MRLEVATSESLPLLMFVRKVEVRSSAPRPADRDHRTEFLLLVVMVLVFRRSFATQGSEVDAGNSLVHLRKDTSFGYHAVAPRPSWTAWWLEEAGSQAGAGPAVAVPARQAAGAEPS
eukprot:scaffold2136_cov242-Pinguiococcus_pyrenoidosus.AAC.23